MEAGEEDKGEDKGDDKGEDEGEADKDSEFHHILEPTLARGRNRCDAGRLISRIRVMIRVRRITKVIP